MQRKSKYEAGDTGKLWTHEGNKFVIGTLQGATLEITAQYNPKELSRTASASWQPHPNTSARQSPSGENNIWMEYKTTEPRTLTFELVFDGYEEGISIASQVEQLESLTLPKDMGSKLPSDRHPQPCVAVWGSQSLRCVVVSVATKLSMFDTSGEPLRATCNVTLKEVDVVAMMAADKDHAGFKSRLDQVAAISNVKKHETRTQRVGPKPVAPVAKPAPAAKTPTPSETKAAPKQTRDATPKQSSDDAATTTRNDAAPDAISSAAPSADAPDAISSADAAPTGDIRGVDGNDYAQGFKPTPFAGNDDLDSPRAPKPVTKTTNADGTVSGTPSSQFAGNSEIDSPRRTPPPNDKPPVTVPKGYKPPTGLE